MPPTPLTRQQINNRAAKKIRQGWGEIKNIRPAKDEDYKEWIRHLPCLVTLWRIGRCGTMAELVELAYKRRSTLHRLSECAHVGDNKGMRQKCSDRETIPLTDWFHREGPESHHKLPRTFFEHHGLNRDEIVVELNKLYERTK